MNDKNQINNMSSVTGSDGTQNCSGSMVTTAATTNVFNEQIEGTEPMEHVAVLCFQQEELGLLMTTNVDNESDCNKKLEQVVGCTNEKEEAATKTTIYLDGNEVTPTSLNRNVHLYNPTPGAHHIIPSSFLGPHNDNCSSTTVENMVDNNNNNNNNDNSTNNEPSNFAVVATAELVVVASCQNGSIEQAAATAAGSRGAGDTGKLQELVHAEIIDEEALERKPAQVTESHKHNARFWFRVAVLLFIILAAVLVIVLVVRSDKRGKKQQQLTTKYPTDKHMEPPEELFKLNPFENNFKKLATFTQHVFLVQSRVQCSSFTTDTSENPDMMIIRCVDSSAATEFIQLESSSNNLNCQPEGDEIIRCNITNTTDQLSYVVFSCAARFRDVYQPMTEITTYPLTGSSCQTDTKIRITSAQICPVNTGNNSSTVQLIPSTTPDSCEIGNTTAIGNLTFCQVEAPQCPFGQYPCNTTVGTITSIDSLDNCDLMDQYQPLDPAIVNLEIESFFGNVVPYI